MSAKISASTDIVEKPVVMSYEDRRESILPLMEQQTKQVVDQSGARWIRCELCGVVETEDKFWTFGGAGHMNLGKCYKCSKRG